MTLPLPAHRYEARAKKAGTGGNIGVDLDGVISSFPREMESLMSAFTAAGHHVYVLSGISEDEVTEADVEAKTQFLTSLGIGPDVYYELIVIPKPHVNKAQIIQDKSIGVFIDNSKKNIKAAARYTVALLLWNSKED